MEPVVRGSIFGRPTNTVLSSPCISVKVAVRPDAKELIVATLHPVSDSWMFDSKLDCGYNGTLYFVHMDVVGGILMQPRAHPVALLKKRILSRQAHMVSRVLEDFW